MISFTCDCGKKKVMDKEDLVSMGVEGLHYCKGECEAKVQAFLDARDELHTKTQEYWNKGYKKLVKEHGEGFVLPDQIWM